MDRFYERYPPDDRVRHQRPVSRSWEGEADVALRSGEPVDERLVGRKICDSVWAIYASSTYVQEHGPMSIADLAKHAMIGFDGIMQNHRVARWLRVAVPSARDVNRNTSMLETLPAVNAGIGVAATACTAQNYDAI
nr:LysR substrate-binding domain-containing protein [Mesorhizobium sp. B4-1-3]